MSGFVDYCQVCQKPFNSRKSAEDHFQSGDHLKRENAVRQASNQDPLFCQVCKCLCNSLRSLLEHKASSAHKERLRRSEGYSCAPDISEEAVLTGKEYCFDEGAQRGKCFACNIELSSYSHAKQHLEGRNHLKKKLTYISGSGEGKSTLSSPEVRFAAPISPDIYTDNLTCHVCNISVTCADNMKQHLESDKHRKKASLCGETSPISDRSNEHPLSSSSLESQVYAPGSNIVSVDQIRSLMSGHSLPGLDSDEDDIRDKDENTYCDVCHVPFTGLSNAQQHYSSEKHKKRAMLPKTNFDDSMNRGGNFSSNFGQSSNIHTTYQVPLNLPRQPAASNPESDLPEYTFTGSTGYCLLCDIQLTSIAHKEQHISGSKHRKAAEKKKSNPVFRGQISGRPVTNSNIQMGSAQQNDPQTYIFENGRGRCFACDIELTSASHAQQHLAGTKHVKTAQRLKEANNGHEYPLSCEVCAISLSGQEPAQQHFTSKKHQQKIAVKMAMAGGSSGTEWTNPINPLDRTQWVWCEVCECPLNTIEQLQQHQTTPKHLAKQASRQFQASNSETSSINSLELDQRMNQLQQDSVNNSSVQELEIIERKMMKLLERKEAILSRKTKNGTPVSVDHSSDPIRPVEERALPTSTPLVNSFLDILQRQKSNQEKTTGASYPSRPLGQQISQNQFQNSEEPKSSVQYAYLRNETSTNFNQRSHLQTGSNVPDASKYRSDSGHYGVDRLNNGGYNSASVYQNRYGNSSQVKQATSSNTQSDLATDSSIPLDFRGANLTRANLERPTVMARDYQRFIAVSDHSSTVFTDSDEDYDGAELFGDGKGNGIVFGKKIKKPSPLKNHQSKNSKMTFGNDNYEEDAEVEDFQIDEPTKPDYSGVNDDDEMLSLRSTPSERNRKQTSHDQQDVASLAESTYSSFDRSFQHKGVARVPPQRSPFHKFFCSICQVNCNTEKALIDHKKGGRHMQMVSGMKAPRIPYPPITKSFKCGEISISDLTVTDPRSYQVELFWKAMISDHVCFLPTGTGKTLVSVMVISAMLQNNPTRPVLFLVDKTLLVYQQALYIIKELGKKIYTRPKLIDEIAIELEERELKIAVLSGGISKLEKIPLWKHDIIVTTAAFCENMIVKEVINWEDFSLVVMDEVHHCVKRHPYATLINNSHKLLDVQQRPKLLGLTASPAGCDSVPKTVNMLKSLLLNLGGVKVAITEGKRELATLEEFQSTADLQILCQPITREEEDFDIQLKIHLFHCYRKMSEWCGHTTKVPGFPTKEDAVSTFELMAKQLEDDAQNNFSYIVDFMKAKEDKDKIHVDLLRLHIKKILQAISELETGSLTFAMPDLQKLMDSEYDNLTRSYGIPCENLIHCIRCYVNSKKSPGGDLQENALQSASFRELINTLNNSSYIDFSYRSQMALVLVQMRSSAKKLSKLLQNTLARLKVTHLVGHGQGSDSGMRVQKQKRTLEGIKANKYDIVVATSVAEEGVDIPACQLVVSLNPPSNVTALVQIRGRARKHGSHFVIICNTEEKKDKINLLIKKEKNMIMAAQEISRSQTR